jgi:hypothetical protein
MYGSRSGSRSSISSFSSGSRDSYDEEDEISNLQVILEVGLRVLLNLVRSFADS